MQSMAARRRRRLSMGLIALGGMLAFVGFIILAFAGSEITWTSSGFYTVDAGFPGLLEYGTLMVGFGLLLVAFGAVAGMSATGLG
jgi:hypothetical protein